jgi:hypothetical protein
MARYWGKLIRKNKITADRVLLSPCLPAADTVDEIIQALCEPLDLPRPVILSKHLKELTQFHRTRFYPDDFMEPFAYDSFEVEQLIEKEEKKGINKPPSGMLKLD